MKAVCYLFLRWQIQLRPCPTETRTALCVTASIDWKEAILHVCCDCRFHLEAGYGRVQMSKGYNCVYIHSYPYIRTVCVQKTCPNLREEYSSCGPYKFTCTHCVRPRTLIERLLHSPLCTKKEEQPKLGARYSNSRGMGLLKRWVIVRVACLPLPVQP